MKKEHSSYIQKIDDNYWAKCYDCSFHRKYENYELAKKIAEKHRKNEELHLLRYL